MEPDLTSQSPGLESVSNPTNPPLVESAAGPPPLTSASPPPLSIGQGHQAQSIRPLLCLVLSLCFVLFLADAAVSFTDESFILFFDNHTLTALRQIVLLFALLASAVVYLLMCVTPLIPKRLFLPIVLFNPVAGLLQIPFAIYSFNKIELITWAICLSQVILGLSLLLWLRRGFTFRWPIIDQTQLQGHGFSWVNLGVFLALNVFVLLPAIGFYLALCASLAVGHLSEGFLALRPAGLTVQVRTYVRADGKTIQLVPMSHVGEPEFYRKLTQSFATNSTILMEGVSDEQHLLTNRITYRRMAKSLGLAPQERAFRPAPVQMVPADIDVQQFTTNTIDFLNLVMLLHSKGVSPENLMKLVQYTPPPHFEEQLLEDLLRKRNRHLVQEIHDQLTESDFLIVPWGAAHMPEIAKEIQKSGFHLQRTSEYVAIRFHPRIKAVVNTKN